MLVIGLTGGIGSGKSTVAKLFSEKGITVIDTDQLARDVTSLGQNALQKISEKFGDEILLPDHTLNRAKLRNIIFADNEKRIWLEKLLHPLIRTEIKRHVDNATSPYCIVVIPLLFETEPNPIINRILVVDATEEQQLKRAHARDSQHDKNLLENVMKTQISRATRLAKADDVIVNDGLIEDLIPQVNQLHDFYIQIGLKK